MCLLIYVGKCGRVSHVKNTSHLLKLINAQTKCRIQRITIKILAIVDPGLG